MALVMEDIDPNEIASFHLGSMVGKKKELVNKWYVRMRPTKRTGLVGFWPINSDFCVLNTYRIMSIVHVHPPASNATVGR
jgi:hypothetical protein